MKSRIAKGIGRRLLVVVAFSWCWLVWGSEASFAQEVRVFPDENADDPEGYGQAQVVHTRWYCDYLSRAVTPASGAADTGYACPSNMMSFVNLGLPPEISNTPWASVVDYYEYCGYDSWSREVNYFSLALKATSQPGYVFDHWEVENSSMDLSGFADIATSEVTIELCEIISDGYGGKNYQPTTGFDPNAQYRAVFRSSAPLPPPTPTPTPAPAVTPPANNGDSNSNGGGSTTPSSAPQCHGNKPADPAPYITHATSSGSGSITLHYQLGGKPYTKYLVEYGYVNADFTFGTTITNPEVGSITINDLNPGTTYNFRLIPMNDCAAGTPSNTFPVTVGGLPKVPGVPNTGRAATSH